MELYGSIWAEKKTLIVKQKIHGRITLPYSQGDTGDIDGYGDRYTDSSYDI